MVSRNEKELLLSSLRGRAALHSLPISEGTTGAVPAPCLGLSSAVGMGCVKWLGRYFPISLGRSTKPFLLRDVSAHSHSIEWAIQLCSPGVLNKGTSEAASVHPPSVFSSIMAHASENKCLLF